jgi:hypothetical protein
MHFKPFVENNIVNFPICNHYLVVEKISKILNWIELLAFQGNISIFEYLNLEIFKSCTCEFHFFWNKERKLRIKDVNNLISKCSFILWMSSSRNGLWVPLDLLIPLPFSLLAWVWSWKVILKWFILFLLTFFKRKRYFKWS